MSALNNLQTAWAHWRLMEKALGSSLRSYLSACEAIKGACEIVPGICSQSALENVISELDQEILMIHSSERELLHTRKYLVQARNKTALVPINQLPVEVLAQIFTTLAAEDECSEVTSISRPDYEAFGRELESAMSVCTHWRQIALEAKSLWSHVDHVTTGRPQTRDLLWLNRSQGSPLHFHMSHPDYPSFRISSMAYLIPYVDAFDSIEFTHHADLSLLNQHHPKNSRKALDTLFRFWFGHGTPGSVQRLVLYSYWKDDSVFLRPLQTSFVSEQSAQFLRPVRVLALTSIVLDWASTVFHGLVDLRISSLMDEVCPSITEIAAILAACPDLETHKLSHVSIKQDDAAPPDPVYVRCLKCLNLRGLKPRLLDMLLRLIIPGSRDVSLSIGLKGQRFLSEDLLHFLRRTRVTTLFVHGLKQPSWFSQIMTALPHLENLAVHSGVLHKNMLPQQPTPGEAPDTLCRVPQLRTLSRLST